MPLFSPISDCPSFFSRAQDFIFPFSFFFPDRAISDRRWRDFWQGSRRFSDDPPSLGIVVFQISGWGDLHAAGGGGFRVPHVADERRADQGLGEALSWKVRYRTLLWFLIQMIKLYEARSLLYRRQILQENIRWKALDEIYKNLRFTCFCTAQNFIFQKQIVTLFRIFGK